MKVDLKKLFTDKTAFPDDMEITLGNGATLTAADLRAYDAASGGALKAEMLKQQNELKTRETELNKAALEVANLYASLTNGKVPDGIESIAGVKVPKGAPKGKPEGTTDDDLKNDPYIRPVLEMLEGLKNTIEELKTKELQPLKTQLAGASTAFMNRELQREFSQLPVKEFGDEPPADLSLKGLIEHALKNGLYTEDRLPNISRAFNDKYGSVLVDRRIKAAEQAGIEKGKKEALTTMMPRPNMGGGPPPPPTGVKVVDTKGKNREQIFTEALNNAAKDADLWAGIHRTPGQA